MLAVNFHRNYEQEETRNHVARTKLLTPAPETQNWMAPEVIEFGKVCLPSNRHHAHVTAGALHDALRLLLAGHGAV